MGNLSGFDASQYEDVASGGYSVLPAGTYVGVFIESQERQSAAGNRYLEFTFEITDGEYRGRRIWDRLNLWHPKEEVQSIARGRLASACRAVKVLKPSDSSDLHNKPIACVLTLKKRKDTGEDANEVQSYAAVPSPVAKKGGSKTLQAVPQAASTGDDDIPF